MMPAVANADWYTHFNEGVIILYGMPFAA